MSTHRQKHRTPFSLIVLLLVLMVCPLPRVKSHTHLADGLTQAESNALAIHVHYFHNDVPVDPSEPHDHWHLDPDDATVAIPGTKVDVAPIVLGLQLPSLAIAFAADGFSSALTASARSQFRLMTLNRKATSLTGLAHQAFLGTFLF